MTATIPYTVAWALGLAAAVAVGLVRFLVREERADRERRRRAARRRAYTRKMLNDGWSR